MSHGHPDFEHPLQLFEAVTRHIGRTVGRNTTVLCSRVLATVEFRNLLLRTNTQLSIQHSWHRLQQLSDGFLRPKRTLGELSNLYSLADIVTNS